MSDNVVWIVDLDASINEAAGLGERVKAWLVGQGVVSLVPCKEADAEHLLTRGSSASAWDSFPYSAASSLRGFEIVIGRQVFHTGDNGIEELRCPACGASHQPDDVPWSDAVGVWYLDQGDPCLDCPACHAKSNIVEWEFVSPWGFGNLAFGFWNWPISERIVGMLESVTGHRCRLVFEHI